MKLHSSSILSIPIIFIILASCRKFVTVAPPQTQIESIKIFSNDVSANSAVAGLYGMTGLSNSTLLNGGFTLYTAAAGDELYPTATNSDVDPFYTNSISPTHSNLLNRLWRPAYSNNGIYTINAILTALEKSPGLADSVKSKLSAECKLFRAQIYFYLMNLFGEVPLITTTDFELTSLLPKSDIKDIQTQIKEDLLEAFNVLSTVYPSVNRARMNKWCAASLLAREYLYEKDWTSAELYSTMVINSGVYSLNSSLNSVFSSTSSNETIWQLVRDNSPTSDGATYLPASTTIRPTFALTTTLMSSFETGDTRKSSWISKNTVGGIDYFYPNKYKSRLASQPVEYLIILRLAEQYLIRAEARAMLGNLSGALSDLNQIRIRAGLSNSLASSQADILVAIQKEKQLELFCEMGHRWIDLKRTGKIDPVLSSTKGTNWQTTDQLFPIPQMEIDRNPFLIQNPGY